MDGELWHLGESGMGGGSSGCNPRIDISPLVDTVILIPIFDSFKYVRNDCTEAAITQPTKECYHISKFAAFLLTGGKLTPSMTSTGRRRRATTGVYRASSSST